MNKLLIIDVQNDFLDIQGAALAVPGALEDAQRTAAFVSRHGTALQSITCTLDSHPVVAIERPGFWMTDAGGPVNPFTEITAAAVISGNFQPRNSALLPEVLVYLKALELGGKYTLMVWPTHCVTGTWGHAMPAVLTSVLAAWEVATQTPVLKVLKGQNPMTEQYSAVQAEVPVDTDDRTFRNYALVGAVKPVADGYLFVAGQALSHCFRATVLDLLDGFSREQKANVVLLTDCTSPVAGFERNAGEFLYYARSLGVKTLTSIEAEALLCKA